MDNFTMICTEIGGFGEVINQYTANEIEFSIVVDCFSGDFKVSSSGAYGNDRIVILCENWIATIFNHGTFICQIEMPKTGKFKFTERHFGKTLNVC